MLKNKIIVKKIRNIFILLMAIIIMLGAYQNIRNSKAENVIQIEMEVSDKSNILSAQTITVDATETSDGNYLLTLPTSVNKNIVTKYYTSSGEEILVDADNNISTIQLTEEEVANKKVQVQSDYDTKEVTVNNQTKLLYNKELQELPNESGTGSQDVIVTGYMPLDVDIEVKEMDLATLTSVKLPSENQTMQKAYEISIFEVVEKQGTETNTTNEVQTQTMENGEQNTDSTQQDVATQADVEPQSEVAEQATTQTENTETERVEYDSSVYGEKITVKTKQEQTNAIKTYTLAEDNKVTEVANVTSGEYVDFESDKGDKTLKYIIATQENEAEENISLMSEDTNSDIAVYASSSSSTLKSASSETSATSAFLGSPNITRQQIESVTFDSNTTGATRVGAEKGLIRSFDGKNNAGTVATSSHDGSTTTWKDLAVNKNGVIAGGTWGTDYLKLNGTSSQWVNLGRMEMFLKNEVTLDAIVTFDSTAKNYSIIGNADDGGVEIALDKGRPKLSIWFEDDANGYTMVRAKNAITSTTDKIRITGTYDGTNMCLYVNGELVELGFLQVDGTEVATTAGQLSTYSVPGKKIKAPINNTVMAIGCNPIRSTAQGNYLSGKVYSAKIYNVGLKQEQIGTVSNWNSSEQGVFSHLIGGFDGFYNTKGEGHKRNAINWYDLTGNQDGILMNGTAAHTASTANQRWGTNYLEFNGSTDWVNLGQMDLTITNKVTFDSIISLDAKGTYTIIGNHDSGGATIGINNGRPRVSMYFEGDSGYTTLQAKVALEPNQIARVTGVYDGTNLSLYVDGELVELGYKMVAGKDVSKNIAAGDKTTLAVSGKKIKDTTNNTVMAIGCNPSGSNAGKSYLDGKVYYAKIFNAGLTQQRIKQIWDVSTQGDYSILAWYGDNSVPYQVHVGSCNEIYANSNSSYLFSYIGYGSACTETSVINGIGLLNTSSATNMEGMFQYCGYRKMTGLSLESNFYTSNVTNMSNMFNGCGQTQLTSFDFGSNFNTSRVTNMSGMFQNFAYKLGSLNLGSQFYTSTVTNMSNMFSGCGKTELTTFSLGSNFNTSKVTNMSGMFQDFAPKLVSLNLGTQFYTSAVTDMSNMFYNCGTTAMTSLDLGPAFTAIASSYADFATNCGKSGSITIYSGSAIYSNSNAFRLGANSSVTIGFSRGTINPKYRPEWSIQSYSVSGSSLVVTLQGNVNTANYTGDSLKTVTNRFTNGSTNLVRAKVDGNSSANNTITKTISNANSTAAQTVTCTLTLANFAESVRQSGNNFLEWSGNVSIDFIPTTIEDAYGNPNLFKADGTVMFTDVIKPEFTYEYTNTTIDHGTKTVTIVFDVADKFFSSSALSTDSSASNIDVVLGGVTATNATKTLTKIEDLSTTINGTSKKTGERYRLVITNLDQGEGNDYSGIMTLAFPAGIVTDTSSNGNVAKTITIGIDDPTTGDGDDTGVIVDVVDPIWKVENINIDKTNKKVTADLIATDKYLTGVENSTLTTSDITISVDGDTNANTVIEKSLTEPTFSTNETTGMKEIKYTLTLTNFEEATRQTGKSFLEYSGTVKITIAAGTITDDTSGDAGGNGVSPSTLYDAAGTNANGLHIGDFVNYDAGTWTQEEINAIQTGVKTNLQTANGSTSFPTNIFQFGGFAAGTSRNGNATPYSTYDYIKDETGNEVTGWRVFDIEGDNMTLISAGNPEDYYHAYSGNSGYVSEYILTGNVDSSWSGADESEYQKRNWSDYVNSGQKAISATVLTKSRIDSWYSKYITAGADTDNETTFQKIYSEPYIKYQSIIDNYSFYWNSDGYGATLAFFKPDSRSFLKSPQLPTKGVRVLVSLSSDVLFNSQKTGTKTLTGGNMDTYGGEQTYNCWAIAEGSSSGTTDGQSNSSKEQEFELGQVDFLNPRFIYEYANTTINHETKTVTVVFDATDKYFNSSTLSTDTTASNITVIVDGTTATNATKSLTKLQDITETVNGTSKKVGEKYQLVISNLDQGDGGSYSGVMTLAFPENIVTDTDTNGNLAKTITIGIDDPTTGDGHDTGIIVDVVDPVWKVENINIDKTNKKVTADLIATDKYLTGVENSTLATSDITVSVDGDANANTVIAKSLSTPTFSTNETTGLKEIKYTLTLNNFEEVTKQTGKSFLEYSGTVKITVAAGTITDDTSGELSGSGVKPSEMFDANGTNTDGLHIGDFVNYDAGTWTQEEINAIQTGLKTNLQTANGSTSLPSNVFQFGGFTAGTSRNGNATPNEDPLMDGTPFNYLRDSSTGSAVTGWRIFDIDGDTVTLISAGNPEDYYNGNQTNNGYISEYILTGNVNSSWSTGGTDKANYQKREWGEYINSSQKAISATPLTKGRLDNWYSKYIEAGANTSTSSTFTKIYNSSYAKYRNMIENYSFYYLATAYNSVPFSSMYGVDPEFRNITSGCEAFGIRMLVTLSADALFDAEKTGTKTITGGNMATYGGNQTYNCWAIAEGSSSGTTDGQSNTSKEQEFELGHVDFIKPRIEKESATKDETAKTETIILNVMDKYLDTTDALENSEITVYIDGENVTGLTKTLSKNTRTTATTSGGVTYETNGDITATVNGTSQIVGQQYKLVLSDFEQATNNSKKYKDWSGTVSIDVAEGAVKDQISASTANTSDAVTVKGDFVDFIAPYLTYQYLTTDIDREGTDADGKSFQMAFEVTDKYYESGKLSIDDLSIQMADGKHTYDLKNTPVTIALNSDEAITAPNVKMTNKTTGEVETVTSTTIGHRYVLTISNLEQLEIAEGNTTLDYSGIVTVSVGANKISDRSGNKNIAKTITSGVSIPDETGDGVVVDVVKPIWRKTSDGSIDFGTKTANIVVKGTDTYYASNSLTVAKLRVYAYSGTTQTDITSSVNPTLSAATRLDESVTVNGTTSTRQYGVQYTITLTNIPVDKDQVKIIIPADTLTDQSGNTNDVYEIKLFATLKSAVISRDEYGNVDSGEKYGDSGFLGNSSIQRRNIESVTFLTSASGAANNKWDVSAAQDGSIWAWYTGSGPYQVYIGSDEFMCANQDSGYLFSHIGSGSNSTATNVINGLEYLNTVTATNMNGMFSGCGYTSMTSLDLGDKFDTSNVTDMREMFYECGYTAMTSLVLGEKFDTSKVTNMRQMFDNCGREALRSLSLGEKFNTSNVTNMNSMFPVCGLTTLTSLDLGDKFDTSNVTDMSDMFSGLTALPILDLGDKFNTSNVTNMSNMFSGLTALTSLDLGDKFDTSNVTNHGKMFAGCTAITTLDLGPKFTKIASDENSEFMSDCGTTGAVIYAPEAIYKDRTSFKLNSGDTSTASGAIPVDAGRTINPIYKPEWEKASSSLDTTTNPENPTISVVVKGSANKSETINGVNINYNSQVTSGLTKDNISVYIDGELDGDTNKNGKIDAGETPSITKTVTSASPSATSAEVTHTITLSGLEEALRQNGKSFKEWSGNIAIKIGGRGESTDTYTANVLTDEYGNQSMMETDASGTWIDVLYKDTDTDHNVNGTMFADFVKPEFTYEYSNTTINHETKTVTIVFDVTDKYFNSSALLTDTTASNIDVVVGGTTPTNATKALTKLQDLTATVNGTSKKVGERYQLVITNLDQGGGNDYSGIMTLAFPADIITDMSTNGNLAKTITIGIDDPTTGDGDDTGVIVDVVDPIWKVENINIDKTNKKVTADLIATDKYLTGVENSTLTTNDITVSVDDDVNANTVITKSLTEPTFSTNETTGMKEIKYTLTLDNFEQATKQTGKSFLEYSGTVKITVAAGTVRDDASAIAGTRTDGHSNTNKEKTFELGHVDFIKPRIEKQSATKDETAKTETIIINVIDKYIDTTKEITADEITIYADEEIVTGITKTFSKNTRTTPATEEDLRYETNGNITTTINGTSKVIGQQYKLVLSDFEQATNNSKKYKDWSGTISIDVAEGAAKDQISGTTANTNELTTLKGDFVDFITPYLTYQYLTTDIDRTGADADGKSFQMAFEVTDKYYESGKLSIDDLSIQMADGKHTYDLKNTPVTIALNSDEAITAPNVKMTNKTTGEVETVTSTTIGHRYVLTISNLEQLEIAEGNTTLDYSGIVTVSVGANKISDRSGNKNIAKTITSGVSIPDETGDGVVVDVVKPIWRRTTGGSLDLTTKTASLVVKGTDTYYASNSLTAGKIKVYAYTGTTPTDITSLVSPALSTATRLDESVTVDGVTSTRQYGVQYTITLTGIPIDKDQVKVVIPAGTLTDQSGNTNEEYETRLFTTLQSAAGETAATSAFLGNSSIQRQNIESVTFVSGIEGAANNKWDVSAAQDGSIWAWYTGSGPYQVYIGSDEFMCANQDSRYLFSYIGYASNSTATNVINGLEYLNIITATNMSYMFNYCGYQKMTSLNLGNNFDTTNVTNMAGMFQNCGQTKMTSINLGTQFYTSKVTDMSNMFNGCGQTELITFSLGSNFDTTKVTNMSGMFQNFAHKLGILNLGTQFYTSEVTDMSNMFNGCGQNAMTTLTLGTNFDTTKVTNMSQMFKDFAKSSTGMTSLDLGDSFYTTSVTDMTRMFNGCGQTAMVALDLGPAFTKIASANTDFATNCGASGIVIYAPESIYSNRTSFKLNKTGQ